MALDFRLRHLRQQGASPDERIHVLVQFKGHVSALRRLGYVVTSSAGDVAAVSLMTGKLEELAGRPEVVYVAASRALRDETDVSSVAIKLNDSSSGARLIPGGGRGAVIGFIDSGFDLTHPCFSNAEGGSRVLAAWDQINLDSVPGEPPVGFGYGVEYTRQDIGALVTSGRVVVMKSQPGAGPHGTYVAGIAAGNGIINNTHHGVFKGVAPEANLVLVAYRNDVPVGGSAFVLDAINYILSFADGRPVVINISQGDNLGAHDGTNLLERAIDHVVSQGRAVVVVSAGNERNGPASHHARGEVAQGYELAVPFVLMTSQTKPVNGDILDLWYSGGDRLSVALETPGGWRSEFVKPDSVAEVEIPSGSRARVYSELDYPGNHDNRIGIILEGGAPWEAGVWKLVLRGDTVAAGGGFDVWADRPNAVTVVGFQDHQSDAATITLPGNARLAVTVGGFISRPSESPKTGTVRGDLAPGSSYGPSRDNRYIKPDLTAPSTLIMSPRMRTDGVPECYDMRGGTSMAAAHVSGVVALAWALCPKLTALQVRDALLATARADEFTGKTPNPSWGHGKLDAKRFYDALTDLVAKGERTTVSDKKVFEFETSPQPKPKNEGRRVGMSVRIDTREEDILVTGKSSDGEEYEGFLVLRKKGAPVKITKPNIDTVNIDTANTAPAEADPGGDECYINGRWYNPCPTGSG